MRVQFFILAAAVFAAGCGEVTEPSKPVAATPTPEAAGTDYAEFALSESDWRAANGALVFDPRAAGLSQKGDAIGIQLPAANSTAFEILRGTPIVAGETMTASMTVTGVSGSEVQLKLARHCSNGPVAQIAEMVALEPVEKTVEISGAFEESYECVRFEARNQTDEPVVFVLSGLSVK